MRLSFSILFVSLLLFSACNNHPASPADNGASPSKKDADTASVFGHAPVKADGTGEEVSIEQKMRNERIAHYQRIYKEALSANDPYTQLMATYNLMADDTEKSRPYIDTLSSLYARLNMAGPAVKMADKVLAQDPNNKMALEIKAGGSAGTGNAQDAVSTNKKLYRQTKDVKYLFAIAEMQFEAQDLNALNNTIKDIEGAPNLGTQHLDMQTDQPGQTQKIPAKAALEYLKGLISLGKNEAAMAEIHLHNATKISPGFVLAQHYLDAMQNQQKMAPTGH